MKESNITQPDLEKRTNLSILEKIETILGILFSIWMITGFKLF